MAPNTSNRFSAIAEADEEPPTEPKLNSVRTENMWDMDDTWQEVKRRGQPKTLVIRNTNNDKKVSPLTPRDSVASDKREDPHEHWCGICRRKFDSKVDFNIHIKQSPKLHENYCNLCKRWFKDRNGLQNHVDHAQGHEVFCNLCLSAFKDKWGLKNHFENNAGGGHNFVCLTCLLGFRSELELTKHLQTSDKHVWCHTCHRRYRNQYDERDQHWKITTRHKHCLQPGCDFDAPSVKLLENHLQYDHFQCQGCKAVFPSQTKLNQHQNTCRMRAVCPNCGAECSGPVALVLHRESCFYCTECEWHTNHEGNYRIVSGMGKTHQESPPVAKSMQHMTKHATAGLQCWRCPGPFRTQSSLINHLENGNCPGFPDFTPLLRCLGEFWHSALYMDVSIHAQIRRNEVNLKETASWISQGVLYPFICRAPGCGKTFGRLSSLVLHVESHACSWDLDTLRLGLLREEFERKCAEKGFAKVSVNGPLV